MPMKKSSSTVGSLSLCRAVALDPTSYVHSGLKSDQIKKHTSQKKSRENIKYAQWQVMIEAGIAINKSTEKLL